MWNEKYKYFFFVIHKFVVCCRDDNIINISKAKKGFTKNFHACKGGSRIKLQTNIIYVFGILKVLKYIYVFFYGTLNIYETYRNYLKVFGWSVYLQYLTRSRFYNEN